MVQQLEQQPKRKGPWAGKLKPDEKKVKVYGYVLQKHWAKAQKEIAEYCKQYR